MILFPAIDIKDGKVVRLKQGVFDDVTSYGDDPLAVAKDFVKQGAKWLHVVDLDGAQTGIIRNMATIINIAKIVPVPVEMGGGIRRAEDIEQLLNGGVRRVVLGTKAIADENFLKETLKRWGERIAISLDCKNGLVTKHGWVDTTDIQAVDFVKKLEKLGATCVIFTDVATDGMLTGPNMKSLEELLSSSSIGVIASGGVSSLDDLRKLKTLESKGLIGAIVGKAIYEKKFTVKDAVAIC